MEGRKENKYNLTGICPKCGDLIKIELVIATELVDTGTTTKPEGKDNGSNEDIKGNGAEHAESAGVRPTDTKEPAGTTSPDNQPGYSKKGGRNKKTGGGKAK